MKQFKIKLVQADVPTRTKRIYTRQLLEALVENFTPTAGELGIADDSIIHFRNVSHEVLSLSLTEDGWVETEIRLLNTPNGRILQSLFEEGTQVSFGFRGLGNHHANDDGTFTVNDDFKLITIDAYQD